MQAVSGSHGGQVGEEVHGGSLLCRRGNGADPACCPLLNRKRREMWVNETPNRPI